LPENGLALIEIKPPLMKKVFSAWFLLLALFLQAQNEISIFDKNYLKVPGIAEMEVIPNEIYLNIPLQEEKEGMKRTVEEQANNYYGGYHHVMGVSNVALMGEGSSYIPNPAVEFKPILIQYSSLAHFEIK
jgi:hypothetical protein